MLKILIVEDDSTLAATLKYMIEDNARYRVVGLAEDLDGAMEAVAEGAPNLALVDLQLARGSTGFAVALRLGDAGVSSLFVSGKAPGFAMPDLALGCLMKPFTGDDVHLALTMAEDVMRGRETLRPRPPANFRLYDRETDQGREAEPAVAFAPVRPSLARRLGQWIAGPAPREGVTAD